MTKLSETIALLSADAQPHKQRKLLVTIVLTLSFALSSWWLFAAFTNMLPRKDYPGALLEPMILAKHVLTLLIAAVGYIQLQKFYQTEASPIRFQWPMWVVAAGLLVVIFIGVSETQSDQLLQAILGKTLWQCALSIFGIGIVIWSGLMYYLSHGAVSNPKLAGFVAGVTAASTAACLYAIGCMEDSPLFYGVWYTAVILFSGGLSAMLAPRILRW